MSNQPEQTTGSRWRRAGVRGALVAIAASGVALVAACSDALDEPSALTQALEPKTNEVMMNANNPLDYATACGLGGPPDIRLPELGTAAAPIRGIVDKTQVGALTSGGWTLIQHFDADVKCLATSTNLMANLWHKNSGGRDWYYLYRYQDPDPTKMQSTLNGVLGFNATSICALDAKLTAALPPGDMTNLFYAGQFNDTTKMDDCSDCHVAGYIAPRPKTLAVAEGNNKKNKFPWLKVQWLPKWTAFTTAFGPVWELGQPTTLPWTSGAGPALVAPPNECQTCHGASWIPARSRDPGTYCDTVFASAFDPNGSMTLAGNAFTDSVACKTFIKGIGCGAGRPGMAADLTSLCPMPAAAPAPMVNDRRMQIQTIQVVSSTAVNIVPMHNPDVLWDLGATTALGNPWVDTLQVWGGPVPGSTTSPMGPTVTVDPDALPSSLPVTGLTPGTTYQFQLQMVDGDGATSFGPLFTVTTPGVDVEPAGHSIAGTLLSGTQAVFTIGSGTVRCTASQVSGTIPATGNPGDPIAVPLSAPTFTSCVAQFGSFSLPATLTTSSANGDFLFEEGCGTNPTFHLPKGGERITASVLGATCTITVAPAGAVDVPATWTNGSPSTLAVSGAVPVATTGGFPCPSATSVTFSAGYAVTDVTAPGSNVTVTKIGCSP